MHFCLPLLGTLSRAHLQCVQTHRRPTLKHTAFSAVSGTIGRSPLQLPAVCLALGARLSRAPLSPVARFPWLGPFRPVPLASLSLHLEVGPHAVVLCHGAAEVDDAALVRALVRRLDAGEAELVRDVAAGHFHHLWRERHCFSTLSHKHVNYVYCKLKVYTFFRIQYFGSTAK